MSSLIDSEDIPNFLLDKATSSGLAKTVVDNGKGFVVSPEVFDLLNKLLKSDDKNATGDAQPLCEWFLGVHVGYRYASEKKQEKLVAMFPFLSPKQHRFRWLPV